MASPVDTRTDQERMTRAVSDLPILYEDDKEADLGESNIHVINDEILHICLKAHLKSRPEYRVFSNMNLYYQDLESQEVSPLPYVSPDTMIVGPSRRACCTYRVVAEGKAGAMFHVEQGSSTG